MILKDVCEEFIIYIKSVRGLSENTVTGYTKDLEHLREILGDDAPIDNVSSEDLRLCIAKLSDAKMAVTSVNRFIAAVRTLFSYARRFGYISKNPALEIKTLKAPKYMPKFLTSPEIDSLCKEPEKNELLWKTRDKALFEMMYSSGCRVSEIVSLKISDLENGNSSAIVTGKGKKDRRVFFEEDAKKALDEYLTDRKKRFKNQAEEDCPYLFVNQNGTHLTSGGVRYILSRYSGEEGINQHINPHAIRHTFATSMLSNGADVRYIQEMLGHSSISTTQRYTHITTESLIEIYKKAHPHGKN